MIIKQWAVLIGIAPTPSSKNILPGKNTVSSNRFVMFLYQDIET